jgi:SOUL heme-binding protein
MSYEAPRYTVRHRSGSVEYRQYEPALFAETVIEGSLGFDAAGNEGFRRLFRYIAGGNTSVPVRQVAGDHGWRVAFMLPGKYSLETAPVPADPRVRVIPVPGKLMAAIRYSGRWTEGNYVTNRDELLATLAKAGIMSAGEPVLSRYNGPLSIPFLRRNEVSVEIDRLPPEFH